MLPTSLRLTTKFVCSFQYEYALKYLCEIQSHLYKDNSELRFT